MKQPRTKRAKRRVAIARDVLKQLDAQRFTPEQGIWIAPVDGKDSSFDVDDPDGTIADLLRGPCTVCALGSMFVCAIERFERQAKLRDLSYGSLNFSIEQRFDGYSNYDHEYLSEVSFEPIDLYEHLEHYFDEAQLELIESEFEARTATFAPHIDPAHDRLRLIMQNIIVNGGTFDPKRQPVLTVPGFK